MPEHRIERSSPGEEDILGLETEEPAVPHPALARPPRDPALAAAARKPLPCTKCGYDLRGLRGGVCPECGTAVKPTPLAGAQRFQTGVSQSSWLDRSALIWGGIGLAIGLGVYAVLFDPIAGPLVFAVDFVATVVIGWAVFLICSMLWIGFDQPLRMTVVQLTGAYGFYAGLGSIAESTPYLGWVIQLIAFVCLLGLLAKLLDIEWRDALILAMASSILKWMLVLWLIRELINSTSGTP